MSDDGRRQLVSVAQELGAAGVEVHLFGGWAEELLGLVPPRAHGDIDLLHVGPSFARVDAYLRSSGLPEVAEKRFPHKRAFVHGGVVVEVLLVQPTERGPVTRLWNDLELRWPALAPKRVTVDGVGAILVASPAALAFYRSHHAAVCAARARSEERERTPRLT